MSRIVVEGKGIEAFDPEKLNQYAVLKVLLWLEDNHSLEWGTVKRAGLRDLHDLRKGIDPCPPGYSDRPCIPS